MLERIKTFSLIMLVSVLVWVFAESESLTQKDAPGVEISFVPPAGSALTVEVPEGQGWRDRVTLVLEGASASITQVQAELRGLRLTPGQVGFGDAAGEQTLDLAAVLGEMNEFRSRGVSVVRVEPPRVRVVIDSLVTVEADVRADAGGAALSGTAEVNPLTAKIVVPKGQRDALPERPVLLAKLGEAETARLVPGQRETVRGVRLVAGEGVTLPAAARIEPTVAEVSLTLLDRRATYTVAAVPVQVRIAAGEMGKWDVEIPETDRFVRGVRVGGPSDLIERIRRNELRLVATVSLTFEELERGITEKPVIFSDLPTGLTIEADDPRVQLKITRRGTGAGESAVPTGPVPGAGGVGPGGPLETPRSGESGRGVDSEE